MSSSALERDLAADVKVAGSGGGWLAPWMLPNTVTCDDRPPVVPPPPPSPW